MNKGRFLFYGINYSPELTGIGKYTSEMVNWLVRNGHNCTVVTSYPYYPYWKVQTPYKNFFFKREVFDEGKLKIYRCPIYIPKKPSGLKRIIHDATFFLTSSIIFIRLLFSKRFDYIITIAPPFHIGLIALAYRFIKGGKINYHIQDLQIDAAKELNMINSQTLFNMMFYLERVILKKVDFVSSISLGMTRKIQEKVNRQVIMLPNWANIISFKPIKDKKGLKNDWGFNEEDYVILYSGNLGEKQGLNILIDLAAAMMPDTKVKFVICGTGTYKQKLLDDANEKNLSNVTFLPLQHYDVFNKFLNMADLHLILQKADASDLVMPSKLTTILAVGGLSLVTAVPGTSLYDIVNENNMGLIAVPEDIKSIVNTIEENIGKDNQLICTNARKFAETNLSINELMNHFLETIHA